MGQLSTACKNREVIAPGIWVAAPILPKTPTAEEAELYSQLHSLPDDELRSVIELHEGVDKDLDQAGRFPYHSCGTNND